MKIKKYSLKISRTLHILMALGLLSAFNTSNTFNTFNIFPAKAAELTQEATAGADLNAGAQSIAESQADSVSVPNIIGSTPVVGSYYTFGKYEQDNNSLNGMEEIEWKVLEIAGNRALLLSRYALDVKPFDPNWELHVTWDKCSLRKWLNGEFFMTAFSNAERPRIPLSNVAAQMNPYNSEPPGENTLDRVFLLNWQEVEKYFPNKEDRICMPTAYAVANGAWTSRENGGSCDYWLRSTGKVDNYAAGVFPDGELLGNGIYANSYGIRPAIWVELL